MRHYFEWNVLPGETIMFSAILVTLLFLAFVYFLVEQHAQERRIATQRDLPREQLLPRHYKSFVELENTLWTTSEEAQRSKWDSGRIRLRPRETELVRNYVQGLRKDFVQANRIFSVVIGRSPTAEILIQMERHRLKIELPYYALYAVVCIHLCRNRVSMKELRLLTEYVSTIAYEVRSILSTLEELGRVEFVETLLRNRSSGPSL
jgi:hypothetical protein